ncbi:cytoskeletal protein RodZ [Microbacterium sp. SORGH_AS 1204]|uniref:G5 domain-containing protein n=1 Tax=Microbacterium sp. SORGH_AS_1204 TaxID=3041785 RepID=UPI00279411EF|nr:G5 domain-containing protein [Microbacterium sp. SORGH_AS_1204]MDQ1137177.1 cytoskeletal protein RodZ [Microbacterium sp. SORGH_AS_1204]
MSGQQPGWFPDPSDATRWRWWDGAAWTDQVGENGRRRSVPLAPPVRRVRLPRWAWIVIVVVALPLLVILWPVVAIAAFVVLVTGIVALWTGKRTWVRFPSRRAAVGATAAAAAIVLATGGVTAALPRASVAPTIAEPVASLTPTASATARSTPEPVVSRTPHTVTTEVSVVAAVPFEKSSVDDPTIMRGETRVTTAGVDGESTAVYRVTMTDGVETARVLVRESVTRAPVSEVTSVGTYDAPAPVAAAPPAAEQSGSEGCDENYADACVPIDSDVDCAGGKGNGPSYFDGVARVVGADVYKLDGDGDGWACNG